ncbi:uncharacterized protein LOC126380440 [Pectinophora gossypiella]|uniref:uncharacterized protein LOC126380440 n=1 Tax=Pectinophora gossypiella TaxID=13191 RepID=UPI00214EDD38|nr:uncharacterized protein LOC126380440 [Pectinophora gossypiella]
MNVASGGVGLVPTPTPSKQKASDDSSSEYEKSSKRAVAFIHTTRGLFKEHHAIYEDLTRKEYPVLIHSAQNTNKSKISMNLLEVNKILKDVQGVQYVKPTGNYYIKVFFACLKDANSFLLSRDLMEKNGWIAKIPFDTIEAQGIIRAPVELSEEEMLEQLTASCNIIGVKRFTKKQNDGTSIPLPTVLITFLSTTRPDHVIYDRIWFTVSEYIKPLLQCFKCYKFGHGSGACKGDQICSICAGDHFFKDCDNPTSLKCSNCFGPHTAVSYSCPIKSAKNKEIKDKISGKYTYASAARKVPIASPDPVVRNQLVSSNSSKFSSSDHPVLLSVSARTPRGRMLVAELINSEGVLHSITKTVIDIIKSKESKSSTTPISTQLIKELLISNFSA